MAITDTLHKLIKGEFFPITEKFHREQDEPSDYNIMVLGCSNAYGKGLEREQVFDFILKEEIEKHHNITVSNWNLARPGKGPDYCKIVFNRHAPKLKPNLAIFWWPGFNRVFTFNKLMDSTFDNIHNNTFFEFNAHSDHEIVRAYYKYFSSDELEIYNWYYNCYLFVESLAKNLNIDVFHTTPKGGIEITLKKYDLTWGDFGDNIVCIDKIGRFLDKVSKTDGHRGIKTHDALGKNIYKILKEKGYFEKL